MQRNIHHLKNKHEKLNHCTQLPSVRYTFQHQCLEAKSKCLGVNASKWIYTRAALGPQSCQGPVPSHSASQLLLSIFIGRAQIGSCIFKKFYLYQATLQVLLSLQGTSSNHPLFLPCSTCRLLSATQARDRTLVSADLSTEGNTESGSLLIKLFMLGLCLVSGPFLQFPSPFLPTGISCLYCLFHHHLLFLHGALAGKLSAGLSYYSEHRWDLYYPPCSPGSRRYHVCNVLQWS